MNESKEFLLRVLEVRNQSLGEIAIHVWGCEEDVVPAKDHFCPAWEGTSKAGPTGVGLIEAHAI